MLVCEQWNYDGMYYHYFYKLQLTYYYYFFFVHAARRGGFVLSACFVCSVRLTSLHRLVCFVSSGSFCRVCVRIKPE
jgi:hypothetical protein